ncbi:cell wall hydrolase [Sphingomonas sp. MJ1 (PH-R8)]|uniref:cell wall hydrolase n=1 Tax=Sphingomonas sp. MJ1 (PH-R8) TaxID=3112950 RepID=UPI003A86D16D
MLVSRGARAPDSSGVRAAPLGTGSHVLDGVLAAVALAAVLVPAWAVTHAPPMPPQASRAMRHAAPRRVLPPAELPAVEPIEFQDMTADEARAFNAGIPFHAGPNPAARPFRFGGPDEDRARASDCLAAAVLYEAGDDPEGQKAVAQVVLNRVRHPAFPKTVCGVVFQGSERATGCQFTFTCDGALARWYSDPFWERARKVADAALAGAVYRPVGHATHYHTDWVVPYWSSSLDKIVAVHTHLFFRWTGWWGTPPAFRFAATGSEPRVAQLAAHFDAHKLPEVLAAETQALAMQKAMALPASALKPSADEPNTFLIHVDAKDAASFPILADRACGERPYCKFMGWTDPRQLPASAKGTLSPQQLTSMSFSYLRDRPRNLERALWNCADFPQPKPQCMRRAPQPIASPAPAVAGEEGPAGLSGVRRKPASQPAAALAAPEAPVAS